MERNELISSFSALWWLGILQGMLMVFFGTAALFWPGLTLLTLVYLFSGFIFVWGIIEILRGLMGMRRRSSWWLSLAFGIGGLIAGTYLIRHLGISLLAFLTLVGIILIARGIFDLVGAFLDGNNTTDRILTAIAGIAALAAGVVILLQPENGGVAFVWVLGIYAILTGSIVLSIAIGLYEEFQNLSQGFKTTPNRARRT